MRIKEYRTSAYVLAAFLLVFLVYTRNIGEGLRLFIGFIVIGFIPGTMIAEYTLASLSQLERAMIAGFVGIWLAPLLMYYFSIFGMKSVSVIFTIAVCAICLALLVFRERIVKGKKSIDPT